MPAPPSENNSLGAKSILWISTYQFLVAFKDLSDPESRLCKMFFSHVFLERVSSVKDRGISVF